MISTQLLQDLTPHLRDAEEIWIAAALMKEEAFDKVQELLKPDTKQHYLVGIDLPTTPTMLRTLQTAKNDKFNAAIFRNNKTFHPKVYLIKKQNGYIGFIGSANLTNGGLENNVEMNYLIKDQEQCASILQWFTDLLPESFPLTDDNIAEYESKFADIQESMEKMKKVRKRIKFTKPPREENSLDEIDFSDRFFKKEDHWAFRSELWEDDSPEANKERADAKKRFLHLHQLIYPQFPKYGLSDLHPNIQSHIISMDYHIPEQTSQQLNAMWLSYGKSQEEIKKYHNLLSGGYRLGDRRNKENDKQSFINHARLQIRIELLEIGIWILFGKNNDGSLFDRDHFKNQMKDPNYRMKFYLALKALPTQYWIEVNDSGKIPVSNFDSADALNAFCKKDNSKKYFIIGRDYKITDDEMSESQLRSTVLTEFQRLFPIYEMMRDKRFK